LKDPARCRQCGAPTAITRIERLEGSDREWHVTLFNFPVLACPSGHNQREAYPDFNVVWSEYLGYKAPIWARLHGLLRRSARCPKCDTALEAPAAGSREVAVCEGTLYVFRATIVGPWSRCPACNLLYLRPRQDFFDAASDAVAGIKRWK
jgi:hypothetical protein